MFLTSAPHLVAKGWFTRPAFDTRDRQPQQKIGKSLLGNAAICCSRKTALQNEPEVQNWQIEIYNWLQTYKVAKVPTHTWLTLFIWFIWLATNTHEQVVTNDSMTRCVEVTKRWSGSLDWGSCVLQTYSQNVNRKSKNKKTWFVWLEKLLVWCHRLTSWVIGIVTRLGDF